MRSAAARAELPAWCSKHNVAFIKFSALQYGPQYFSFGCPVCVGKIREDVQRELNRARKARSRNYEATGKLKPG